MKIVTPEKTTVEFLFASLDSYDYDGNTSNMSIDADRLAQLRKESETFVKSLERVARLVVVPQQESFSVYTRPTTGQNLAKSGQTITILNEDWPDKVKHATKATVAAREEMILDLTRLHRNLEETFSAVTLPDDVRPLVIFSRPPSDDYQLVDQIRDAKGLRGAGNQMMIFFVCQHDGREVAVRAMKNSQNKLKLSIMLRPAAEDDTFHLVAGEQFRISQKGLDCSLKPLQSFKQGFASNLNLKDIQRRKQDLRCSMATYAISYKDLYGSWPPGMNVSESDDGGVTVYLDGDAEDESNDEE